VGKDFGKEMEILCPVMETYLPGCLTRAGAPLLGCPAAEMGLQIGPLFIAEDTRIYGELFERLGSTHIAGIIGEINRDGFSPSGGAFQNFGNRVDAILFVVQYHFHFCCFSSWVMLTSK